MSGANRLCPVCGAHARRITGAEHATRRPHPAASMACYLSCTGCGLVYLDPVPSASILEREYNANGPAALDLVAPAGESAVPWRAAELPPGGNGRYRARLPLNSSFAALLQSTIASHASHRPRVLEIGFGSGAIIESLLHSGVDAYGLDLDRRAVARLSDRYPNRFVAADVLEFQSAEPFDLIYSTNFLEHILEPQALFDRVGALLGHGGRLLFMTPNAASLDARLFGRHWYQLWFPQHVLLYTPQAIRIVLHRAGFLIERLRTLGSPGTSWALSTRRLLRSLGVPIDPAQASVMERLLYIPPALAAASLGRSSELVIQAMRTDRS